MPSYKLTIEYDGTGYAGWQRQPNQLTVQRTLEEALFQISRITIPTVAAGRTDAGVHALGQVVSFRSKQPISTEEWTRSLNGVLPHDVCVHHIERVPETFHARYSATKKIYEYRILNHSIRPVLNRLRVWHIRKSLDLPALQEAAHMLEGQHNFSSFEGSPTENRNPICHLHAIHLHSEPPTIRLTCTANRFLKQMVRAIVGTLIEVAQGLRSPVAMQAILEAQDRSAAGKTAPPYGLYLLGIEYDQKER